MVFEHGLVTVAQEALAAVAALQLVDDQRAGAHSKRRVVHREGRVADDRQQRRIGLLRLGLARQQRLQRFARQRNVVGQHMHRRRPARQRLEPGDGLQRSLGHAERAGVDFGQTLVAFVAAFPDAEVGCAVGACQVVHQVLHEGHFVGVAHDGQARGAHLRELQHEDRRRIDLQVAPFSVADDGLAGRGGVLRVQGVERVLGVLETLDLLCLPHHRREQPAHQLHDRPFQFGGAFGVLAPVCQRQHPHGEDAVDVVAHPGVGVVAVHRGRGAGRQQARRGILAREDDLLHLVEDAVELLATGTDLGGGARRLFHVGFDGSRAVYARNRRTRTLRGQVDTGL